MKIAAQAYTFRQEMAADPSRALARLRETGYELVELAGLYDRSPAAIREALDAAGVAAVSAHVPWARLTGGDAADELHELGIQDAVVPSMPPERRAEGADGYRRFGQELAEMAARLSAEDLRLHYHNHAFELEPQGQETGLAVLAGAAGPNVGLELDLAWLRAGDQDPRQWVEGTERERLRLVHLKDVAFEGGQAIDEVVGEGVIDWSTLLPACRAAGVEWGVVEQDNPKGDPFEALAASLRALRNLGYA